MVTDSPYFVVPLVLLAGAVGAFRALGAVGIGRFQSWRDSVRYALSIMFVFTAVAHFTGTRADLVRMVPDLLPYPELLVTITGLLELLGAVGLLWRPTARYAGTGLSFLLVVMFPANIVAAQEGLIIAGRLATPIWFRLLIQVIFVLLLLWATR